ncbi:NAC domain-containing protein 91-like [Hibiscus syriacus]|uniref:NAC domain-containing protein 91-like n=1 Tax=Hibiscus syriacus TaxID=106335 RepID=UPI001922C93B|nr:NAC domain-containing protein 91-like [Hibiscus syriacus]
MNTVKGFRFHPTDEELIEFLHIKTSDRHSLVQVIDEVPDICQWEPWQLAESSKLQTGDRLWYFIYSPKYKYRNSKRINRTTRDGYWKPTGNARKVIDPKTRKLIGTKKTLVYYKGQCNDGNKIKTCWVMHEYELKADLNSSDTDQKTFNLCKLKRRVDLSSTNAGQSGQDNEGYGVHDSCAGEKSNQHNMVSEDAVSDLSSSLVNPVDKDVIPKVRCPMLNFIIVYLR